jgi:hypothetical protein
VWWWIWREELKEAEGRPDGGKSSRVAVDLAGEELVTVDLAGEELVAAALGGGVGRGGGGRGG